MTQGKADQILPGMLNEKERELRNSFLLQIKNIPGGESIKKCIQCGTCTATCPVSYTMDITPREIIALFRAKDIDTILSSRTIWICASCYSLAIENEIFPKKFPVYALSNSFVWFVNHLGLSYEPGLLVAYCLRTNPFKLLGMVPLFLKLAKNGRIGFFPRKIKNKKNFSKILKEAEIVENIIPMQES